MSQTATFDASQLPGPTLEDFADAAATLQGVAQETPVEVSRYLSQVLGQAGVAQV
jgi:threonine dehydratase